MVVLHRIDGNDVYTSHALRLERVVAVEVPWDLGVTCSSKRSRDADLRGSVPACHEVGLLFEICAIADPHLVRGMRNWHPMGPVYLTRLPITNVDDCYSPAIHFLADDQGEFARATGLIFDATPILGGPRSKV